MRTEAAAVARRRARVRVEGTVQGVGFRPYVYHLAGSLMLGGFVRNDARGVLTEVEGPPLAVQRFLERLPVEAPVLAGIEHVAVEELTPCGDECFRIVESDDSTPPAALVSPDTATCDACLAELFAPADRRFRYPFINCTNCGPRFTIVRGIPYDRPLTTMADFTMCDQCRAEYDDPDNRRFHAQPNACATCGPRVRLVDRAGAAVMGAAARDAVDAAARALNRGAIVAVKGVGGFHLACRADHGEAVRRLRARKHREDKPFALMAGDLAAAHRLVRLDVEEERLLTGRARPIVLARRQRDARVADEVAPGHRDLGVMLPYSPLHHLLLADTGVPLVMTSGNVSDEPIAYRDADALERLAGIADLFLLHDRPIHTRTDDSIVRVVSLGGRRTPLMVRRSRGYVPTPLKMPVHAEQPLVAYGGELKNTFCVVRGERAWVGHHIGDLENYETLRSFEEGIAHLEGLFAIEPRVAAHDLHPDYLSTKVALEARELEPVGVQHHHAHLAACLAEHGEEGPAIGVIFDGTGYGADGTIWGGELLLGGLTGFERIGHLWPVRLPGGAAAIREPWRMACAWLAAITDGEPPRPATLEARVDAERWRAVARLARSGVASPMTTSVGRLFDAVAALCGLRTEVTYEGQAAIELEIAVDARDEGCYPMPVRIARQELLLDARALIRAVVRDVSAAVPVSNIAARFHHGLLHAAIHACGLAAQRRRVSTVVLSGGVFQNVLMLEGMAAQLEQRGLRVLVPERLPLNDGGISFGQAAIAAARGRTAGQPPHGSRAHHREAVSCVSPYLGRLSEWPTSGIALRR
ncbi:MAG TPA: carbamoyltransferase HypF [Gemmatimonadaceae bacterium]|nr:carbamoyltransferase HypF [Gemmatimonadaceae bacterium]